ncbi:MAG: hypothetical protein QOJ70_190 [Acidobacteriota bacterium]|nr:hypothetical protein [Acidobacteriota bacterium]
MTVILKRAAVAVLVLCSLAAAFGPRTLAQSKKARRVTTRAPRFEDYTVREVYKGRPARIRLDSKKAREFRTRLREDSRGGPNFAGHYTVVVWGCGTGCAQMGVVDARTGRVYFPPLEFMDIPDMEDEGSRSHFFRLDSRLLVLTRNHYDMQWTYTAYYFLFDDNRFRLLRKAEEHMPPQPADEN